MASRGITGCRMPAPATSSGIGCAPCRTRIRCTYEVTAATCFHQDDYAASWTSRGHLAKANQVRDAFAGNPLIKADAVKIFLDGVLEGSFTSPLPPNAGMLENYQHPHSGPGSRQRRGEHHRRQRGCGQQRIVN